MIFQVLLAECLIIYSVTRASDRCLGKTRCTMAHELEIYFCYTWYTSWVVTAEDLSALSPYDKGPVILVAFRTASHYHLNYWKMEISSLFKFRHFLTWCHFSKPSQFLFSSCGDCSYFIHAWWQAEVVMALLLSFAESFHICFGASNWWMLWSWAPLSWLDWQTWLSSLLTIKVYFDSNGLLPMFCNVWWSTGY